MPEQEMTPDEFHGLKGKFKQWTSLGVIGLLSLMTLYLVVWQNPTTNKQHVEHLVELQKTFATELKTERDSARLDAEKSRQHGNTAAQTFAEGLRENAKAIQSLNETFIRVQEQTQANQRVMIDLQLKKMEQDKVK